MSYKEKLKDPRWQKRRLEIMQRDDFTCQRCKDKEETLHVHHLHYVYGIEPWDYHPDFLLTLCETCHYYEFGMKDAKESILIEMARKQWLTEDYIEFAKQVRDNHWSITFIRHLNKFDYPSQKIVISRALKHLGKLRSKLLR